MRLGIDDHIGGGSGSTDRARTQLISSVYSSWLCDDGFHFPNWYGSEHTTATNKANLSSVHRSTIRCRWWEQVSVCVVV
jgi:hypothetical protein